MDPNEKPIDSLKLIPVDFFEKHLKEPLEYYHEYLKKIFGNNAHFNMLAYSKKHLNYIIRLKAGEEIDEVIQEFWSVQDIQ